MESLQSVIQFILNLGAAVFVPALMIIIGLNVRMKVRDAVSAGIILGVAFLGMNIVIGFMIEALTPAAQGLAERTGINLSILDGGWTSMATLAWAWPFAFLMFPLQLGINAIMLVINKNENLERRSMERLGQNFNSRTYYRCNTKCLLSIYCCRNSNCYRTNSM